MQIGLLALFVWSSNALAIAPFPRSPDPRLTPGSLCREPEGRRYSEGVPVCRRSVTPETKKSIIRVYDRLGYQIGMIGRHRFKIDHYIPLCMGGSNEVDNLWPQHETIFELTDPLESACCEKMAIGRLRQARAIEYIQRGKAHPESVRRLLIEIERL